MISTRGMLTKTVAEKKPTEQTLLVEYQKAQDSAQFHDGLGWTSTGITWALNAVLLGFALAHSGRIVYITLLSLLGMAMLLFQVHIHFVCRSITKHKYERCKDIEEMLGMLANRTLIYEYDSVLYYWCVTGLLGGIWIYVVVEAFYH